MTIELACGKQSGWTGEYIGRPILKSTVEAVQMGSVLGNPYRVLSRTEKENTRVVALYKKWLWERIKGDDSLGRAVRAELQRLKMLAAEGTLRLDCWCSLDMPCHRDVVKACLEWSIANNYDFYVLESA